MQKKMGREDKYVHVTNENLRSILSKTTWRRGGGFGWLLRVLSRCLQYKKLKRNLKYLLFVSFFFFLIFGRLSFVKRNGVFWFWQVNACVMGMGGSGLHDRGVSI